METIDHGFIKNEKKNNCNKGISCVQCKNTMEQFKNTQTNTSEYINSAFTKYELLLWIDSNEVYIKRKGTFHVNDYKARDIVIADMGRNIGSELSYEHYAIIIKNEYDRVFVVPCSSSKVRKAYHKTTGKLFDEYVIGNISDGFTKETVIMLRESRWISKSRIIKKTKTSISKKLFDNVYEKLFKDIFESRYYILESIKGKNEELEVRNKILETEILELKAAYNKLIGKNNEIANKRIENY